MKIQILGTGCPKCRQLAEAADAVAQALELDFTLEKVTNIDEITAMGVMITPALAVDGQVLVSGHIPDGTTLRSLLGGLDN